jgi:hypothetical protein
MSQPPFDRFVEILRQIVEARGLKLLCTIADDSEASAVVELRTGAEISLQLRFGFHERKNGALSSAYEFLVRWPRAERMFRDLQPPPSYDINELPRKVIEWRNRLHPIAHLRFYQDKSYFSRPSPVELEASESNLIGQVLAEVVDTSIGRVIPEYSQYCDPNELARAALEPEPMSRLMMSPMTVATILVAAGKRQEFERWRSAYRSGFMGKPTRKPKVQQRDEQYMAALEGQLGE